MLLTGVCVVSAGALFARVGLDRGATGFDLALWRVTTSALLVLGVSTCRRQRPTKLSAGDQWRLAVAGLFMAIHFVTWLTSLRYISVARSTLLVSTSPLWASFVEFFAPNHKPGRQFWLGLALAAIGVLLFTQPWATSQKAAAIKDGPAWFGDAMALLGAIAIVPYLNLSQRVQAESGTLQAVTWIYVAGALCLWSVAIPMGQATVPTSAYVWFAFLGMAVFSQSIGHTALNWSMRHFTAGQVTAATLLEPVFAATFAWPLFGEAITTTQAVGGMIVLAGVAATLSPKPPPNLKA